MVHLVFAKESADFRGFLGGAGPGLLLGLGDREGRGREFK